MWHRSRMLAAGLLALGLLARPAAAQITPTYTFTQDTVISPSQVNANFNLLQNALNRTGGTITGNITVSSGVTIDGIDLSAYLDQSVKTTASPTFAGLTLSGNLGGTTATLSNTSATALDVAGGITAGTGNVGIVDTTGKIPAISSTYFTSLAGTNLTGVALLGSANAYTARNDFLTYTETDVALTPGTSVTIDLNLGTHFTLSNTTTITTLTISNAPSSSKVGAFTLAITANGSSHPITWPASVKWAGGTAPTLTTTNTKVDILTFLTYDGGTTWYAFVGGQNF